MSGPVEKHPQPNGWLIHSRQSDHSYWKLHDEFKNTCSGRVGGISGISKIVDIYIDGLIDWGSKLSCHGTARAASLGLSLDDIEDMRTALSWLESGESIWETLREQKLTWKDIRDEAGFRGYDAHEVFRALAEGREPEITRGYDESIVSWWKANEPVTEQVEQVVCSLREVGIPFAGRFDWRGKLGGQTVLLDLKTSGYIGRSFAVQLNGYDLACFRAGFGLADRLMILQAQEDGSIAQEIEVEQDHDDFLVALDLHARGKRIDSGLRKQYREKKKAREAVAA